MDSDYLTQHHITLFDAKGSNARSVADYIVATLAALHQMGKRTGKLAGVIGVGEVGSRVVKRLHAAGFNVICFDPLKAPLDKYHQYVSLDELTECDVICIHANLHESPPFPSKHLLNADFLSKLKSEVIIINASRGGIIDEDALLTTNKSITYCTDVYCEEPAINPRIVDFATLCTPHIAGHSIEAKQAAVVQISQQLHHHYGLPMPVINSPIAQVSSGHYSDTAWQDLVLRLYNPLIDTHILKTAADKRSAFLAQRQAHQYRHDFNCYEAEGVNQNIGVLLGLSD
jgi:erythronate-4-phosphate dehydrogenase